METGELYFWTATINQCQNLLWDDVYKEVVIGSLEYLTDARKIEVFGFVIMPSHLHFIWRTIEKNGKESAQASFLKFTAHEFRKLLLTHESEKILWYEVNAANKSHEFWQRDSLAIHLFSKKVAFQKLNYIHQNPLAGHWHLVSDPCDYKYSSARYYELNERNFTFLKDLREMF